MLTERIGVLASVISHLNFHEDPKVLRWEFYGRLHRDKVNPAALSITPLVEDKEKLSLRLSAKTMEDVSNLEFSTEESRGSFYLWIRRRENILMRLGLKRNEVRLVPHNHEWTEEFLRVKKDIVKETRLEPYKEILCKA